MDRYLVMSVFSISGLRYNQKVIALARKPSAEEMPGR